VHFPSLQILKYEGPKEIVNEGEEEDEEGGSQVEPQEDAPLVRGDSVKKSDSPTSTGKRQVIFFHCYEHFRSSVYYCCFTYCSIIQICFLC
jgi:hypothetical protein